MPDGSYDEITDGLVDQPARAIHHPTGFLERASMKPTPSLLAAAALIVAVFGAASARAAGVEILNEGFGNVAGLSGWTQVNRSVLPGNPWFQGNAGLFPAQSGAADSYVAANFLSAAGGSGSVDNWLITPTLDLSGPTVLSFYTRTDNVPGAAFNDVLEVRFSPGSGSDPSGFGTVLATIGGTASYPSDWQQFTASVDANGSGRFAFRYVGQADTLNYVGLDTVKVVTSVPEPAAWAMTVLGLGLLGVVRKLSRR
jgi:hypothetical protein